MYKGNRGITLIVLVMTIVLMLIISTTLIYGLKYNVANNELRAMRSDITILQNKINVYYAINNAIPTINQYTPPTMSDKNINDNENYYVIDLQALEGITLNKGMGYTDIKSGRQTVQNVTDVYIINEYTHTIYYAGGVTVKGITYYTLEEEFTQLNILGIENRPELSEGMTPVKYITDGGYWQATTANDIEWYNYSEKKWANVMLNDGLVVDANGVVTTSGSMLVWIPRYAYQITAGYHSNTVGTVNIKFLRGTTNVPQGELTPITNTLGTSDGEWAVHPAFNYGGIAISGFWVGKYESSNQYCNANATTGQTAYEDLSDPTVKILPGVTSWRNLSISSMYDECIKMSSEDNIYNLSRDDDTHLLKNSEWGAISYLAQSSYGVNSEIWINPNSNFITGQAGSSVNASGTSSTNSYNSTNGIKASTTGNVTGVYDLNGNAYEYVAGYINNGDLALEDNGDSLVNNAPIKNKDIYVVSGTDTSSTNYTANNSKYGDAIYETSSSSTGGNSWNHEKSIYPATTDPFFVRGSHYNNTTLSGIFAYEANDGTANTSYGFRVGLVVNEGRVTKNTVKVAEAGEVISLTNGVQQMADGAGAIAPVPVGFSYLTGTKSTGFVMKNDTDNNEFVWIPCDLASNNPEEGTLIYQTYDWGKGTSAAYYTEYYNSNATTNSTIIAEINTSVGTYKGFYISRYEAGTTTKRTSSQSLTAVLSRATSTTTPIYSYGCVNWQQAINLAGGLYTKNVSNNVYVQSRLISSRGWDTALKFIETEDSGYPINSVDKGWSANNKSGNPNFETGKPVGTNANMKKGIYDMGGNVREWTADIDRYDSTNRLSRGGDYVNSGSNVPPAYRWETSYDGYSTSMGFRIALYL